MILKLKIITHYQKLIFQLLFKEKMMYNAEDELSQSLFHSLMTRIFFCLSRVDNADASSEENEVFKWNKKRVHEKNFNIDEPTLIVKSTGDKFWWNGNLSNQKSVVKTNNKNFSKMTIGNSLNEFTKMEQLVAAEIIKIERNVASIELTVSQKKRVN